MDDLYALQSQTASLELSHGSFDLAAESYAKSLQRAREMDSPNEITDAAYSLALCRAELGDLPSAAASLREARYAAATVKRNDVDIRLLSARVALLDHRYPDATGELAAVHDASPPQQAQAGLLAAKIELAQGHAPTAAQNLVAINSEIEKLNDPATTATYCSALGEVELAENKPRDAATQFDRAAQLFREAHRYRPLPATLARAGRAWRAAGDAKFAADRLYRAARVDAKYLEEAHAAAVAAGDKDLIAMLAALVPTTQP